MAGASIGAERTEGTVDARRARPRGAPSRFVVRVGQPAQSPSGWLVVQPVLPVKVFPDPLPS